MATRNLYELDSVAATLLYAIESGNTLLAIQSTKELIDSDELILTQHILTLAWWLTEPSKYTITADMTPKELLYCLLESNQSYEPPFSPSIIEPPNAGTHIMPPPRIWKKLPTGWTPHMAGRLWSILQYDIRQQYPSHMTELVRPLLTKNLESVISLLNALNIPTFYIQCLTNAKYPLNERILYHCFAAIHSQLLSPNKPQWDVLWNQSSGRSFNIPAEALGYWNVNQSPVDKLIGPPILVTYNASNYWKTQIKTHGLIIELNNIFVFPNDDLHESFYNNFPEDVPDEWSIAERHKSHGIIPVGTKSPWAVVFHELIASRN